MLTKTQLKIMELFVSQITEKFSIKKISENIKKPYPLVHRAVKSLINSEFVIKDKQKFLSLDYKKNHLELAYVESLRKREFLNKNKTIALFVKDVLEKISLDFFIFLIFGSSAKYKQKPGDVDILIIIENKDKIKETDKVLHNLASNFSLKFDINVVSVESVYEMLAKRDGVNVMNETLNNHILIFGAENYYGLLKNAR